MHKRTNKEIFLSLGLVLIPVTVLLITVIVVNFLNKAPEPVMAEDEVEEIIIQEMPTLNINIQAKAAYVVDLNKNKVLYAKNENEKLPLASLTKIMTALVAERNADGSQLIKISDKDLATEGEYFLSSQEIFRLKDLINFTMTGSVNDTATAISGILNNEKSFIEEMNQTAKKIGLSETTFKNVTGLDVDLNTASAMGSAKDIFILLQYVMFNYPEIFDATTVKNLSIRSLGGNLHTVKNTNEITGELPGLIASKTGYTDLAGGNLALIVDLGLNEPIAIIVLGSPNSQTRFDDALKIIENIKK
jgi:serine-type D-Ala-D-Ala carboxypeptidase (penicillin-binding protein 5/6)